MICPQCGIILEKNLNDSAFCSPECQENFYAEEKHCRNCYQLSSDKKFCRGTGNKIVPPFYCIAFKTAAEYLKEIDEIDKMLEEEKNVLSER